MWVGGEEQCARADGRVRIAMCSSSNRNYVVMRMNKRDDVMRSHRGIALISRVDGAKREHQSLVTENQMLQKYINNSLTSTAVFGATQTNAGASIAKSSD